LDEGDGIPPGDLENIFDKFYRARKADHVRAGTGLGLAICRGFVEAMHGTIVAGNRVQLVPFNQFSWWNRYQIDPVWAAALGAIYFSDSFASSDDSVKLPGFVRFDAALYMKINKTWKAQLNVENIFNKGYWASADGNNNLSPGASRTVRVSMTANF
jgi:catecholate siderophore receptor